MHRFVSTGYVVAIGIAALAAAVEAAAAPVGPWPLIALVLGIYALHLVAVHDVQRRAARLAPASSPDGPAREADSTRRDREAAAAELREAHRLRAEAEQQWRLLRDMVQERLSRRGGAPAGISLAEGAGVDAIAGGLHSGAHAGSRSASASSAKDESAGRGYGRW